MGLLYLLRACDVCVCGGVGLMITSKKRQEFRIKLQKRARQRLEKRMEIFREDYDLLQVYGVQPGALPPPGGGYCPAPSHFTHACA